MSMIRRMSKKTEERIGALSRKKEEFESAVARTIMGPSRSKTISNRLSRPFPVDDSARAYPETPRPRTSQVPDVREEVRHRPGPAKPVGNQRRRANTVASQQATVFQDGATKNGLRFGHEQKPRCTEDLYFDCGLLPNQGYEELDRKETLKELELWAFHNPMSAMHIVALAKKWQLRRRHSFTPILTDLRLYSRTIAPEHEKKLAAAYERGEKGVDDRLAADVARKGSKHLAEKEAVRHTIRRATIKNDRKEMFSTSRLSSPVDKSGVPSLPLTVVALYCDVTDRKIEHAIKDENMLRDWRRRFPVSDHHLNRVIERWSSDITPVDISPAKVKPYVKIQEASPVGEEPVRGLSQATRGRKKSIQPSRTRLTSLAGSQRRSSRAQAWPRSTEFLTSV